MSQPHALRRFAAALALAGATLLGACAAPQPPAPPMLARDAAPQSILWIGNSFFYFNDSLHSHFGSLVASGTDGARVRGTSSTISGAGLDWHDIDSLLRPDGLGRYSFLADNSIRFNPPGRQYDTAIVMDCSQCPVHPALQANFHATVKRFSDRLKQAGIRPVLFMSWAYKDAPEMTAGLAEQYTKAGRDNGAVVIPVGLAFARAIAMKPSLELYNRDKRHPSLAGTYLSAATTYATLYGKSPVGLKYTAGLDADTVQVLQTAAWETARAYAQR